ncbi:hypothetical protein F0267_23095 [Vibrio coralliilyticus]|uniref:Uncharacterized protein n=1 Tax=Vibrio coralliilyticus TaxID=190893 RepID=A0AAN0VXT9_9VIBR|nr:hypothetical protein [Vibrio coralliilyticus]AIW18816.1 hypothetical protein IX92_07055 [Vibrio coralliilyticus]NOH41118.1 hypothetical protein [Vibrio coralliilyticus]
MLPEEIASAMKDIAQNVCETYKKNLPILKHHAHSAYEFYVDNKELSIVFGGLLLFCSILWLWFDATSDFGLNAFTETLGILVTVFLVERILTKKEAKRALPLRLAAYEDVRLLSCRLIKFWHEIYRSSVPGTTPETIEQLLLRKC